MTATPSQHSFHIPVMGLAFTIDTPIRVAHYGISSVVSITDDELIEKMSQFYSEKFQLPYEQITQKVADFRAKRITHYLNLLDRVVREKFEKFKKELAEDSEALQQFMALLANNSPIKKGFEQILADGQNLKEKIAQFAEAFLHPGDIDVNIITKVDKENFYNHKPLPIEYNDAHASLRGFANSNLNSSVVLSAGMNPRLYSYFENFSDFFPNEQGLLKKKIILKVSDFRSAMIQGNFLAKKGLWVSEYRIESGLNCGGHAFATDGFLLGPILQEFRDKKQDLIASAHELMCKALAQKGLPVPVRPMLLKITAQGGVGTAEEHEFLLNQYALDSIGWGSPFLLVPEATAVDQETRQLLAKAKTDDFYLSHISPLGVPFNTVKGTSNEQIKQRRIAAEKAGSSCPKKFLALNKTPDGKAICTASAKYQKARLEELESGKYTVTPEHYQELQQKITEKSCLCVGLANAAYLENEIPIHGQHQGVVICPGPNLAYFDREISLTEMVRHIYGNHDLLAHSKRPNVFVNELKMYVDYLSNEIDTTLDATDMQIKKWQTFMNNLTAGIDYYQQLLSTVGYFNACKKEILQKLQEYRDRLELVVIAKPEAVCQ